MNSLSLGQVVIVCQSINFTVVVLSLSLHSATSPSPPTLGQKTSGGGKGSEGYDPTRRDYHPVDHACWKRGEK